jgi:hypothetical protein
MAFLSAGCPGSIRLDAKSTMASLAPQRGRQTYGYQRKWDVKDPERVYISHCLSLFPIALLSLTDGTTTTEFNPIYTNNQHPELKHLLFDLPCLSALNQLLHSSPDIFKPFHTHPRSTQTSEVYNEPDGSRNPSVIPEKIIRYHDNINIDVG